MTAQKHTRGTWRAIKAPHGPIDILDERGHDIVTVYGSVADPTRQQANARLIAASPTMLEALYEAEEYFDNRADADHDETGFVPNEEMKLLTVVRAAIAKAEGQ